MNFSIRIPIILGSILLVWSTHLIIAPYSYVNSERVLKQHARDIMQNISDLTLEQSYNHLSKATSAAHLAKQLLSSDIFGNYDDGLGSLERYFFDQLTIHPHLAGIYFGNPKGDFFYVSRNDSKVPGGFRTKIIRNTPEGWDVELRWREDDYTFLGRDHTPEDTYDPRTRPWYKKVMEQRRIVWTSPYIFFTSKKPGVTIAGPAFKDFEEMKGIVGVDIEIDELSSFIGRLRVGKEGKAFIFNRDLDVIAFHDMNKLTVPSDDKGGLRLAKLKDLGDPVIEAAYNAVDWDRQPDGEIKFSEPKYINYEFGGENYMAMFTPFPGAELSWIIGVYVPENDYLGSLKENQNILFYATVLVTILASWLALKFAGRITRPIESLQKEARAIEENDLKTRFDIDSSFSEIQETANSFARMKASLIHFKDRLREREEIYRAITKSANDAIVMIDASRRVSYWNPAAEKLFGYKEKEALGRDVADLLAPERFAQEAKEGFAKFISTGDGPYSNAAIEIKCRNKVGHELPVELSLSRIQVGGAWQVAGIFRDVTERKKGENLKKQLVRDLHDGIGGNLANIKLLSEMVKQGGGGEFSDKALESISEVSDSCISEIRNYMNVLDNKNLDWEEVTSELRQYCGKTLEPHRITFEMVSSIEDGSAAPSTLAYMNIFKIVREAVTNIIKHSGADKARLCLSVTVEEFELVISDNGNAVPRKSGSGRGLMTMQSRAKELGGTITFSYEGGMTVTLLVPLNGAVEYRGRV
ncbi:MAG: hypothetical protein C0608_04610 [Deltaproteobacteria bacterium]|nr:MAG: hypothetical protein C0608_04610 [Deltaproteobacteria bacterium]